MSDTTRIVLSLKNFYIIIFICGANTVVYRWRFNRSNCKVEDNFPLNIEPGDWYLHLLHAEVGKIKFLNEEMSVYRRHPGGIWYQSYEDDSFYMRNGIKHLKFYVEATKRFHGDFSKEIDIIASKTIMAAISHKNFTLLQNFSEIYPDIFTANYEKVKILFAALNSPTIRKAIRKQIDHFRLLAKLAVGRKKKRYQEKYKLLKSTYKAYRLKPAVKQQVNSPKLTALLFGRKMERHFGDVRFRA